VGHTNIVQATSKKKPPNRASVRCLNSSSGRSGGCSKSQLANAQSTRKIKTNCQAKETETNFSKIVCCDLQSLGDEIRLEGETNIELDDIEIELPDETKLTFNLTWLRDSCHCSLCTHQHSRQRLFTPKEFRKQMFAVRDVRLASKQVLGAKKTEQICWPSFSEAEDSAHARSESAQDSLTYLEVDWADGHRSLYSLDWLKTIACLYRKPSGQLKLTNSDNFNFKLPNDDFYLPRRTHTVDQVYWSAGSIDTLLEPVDFNDLTDGFDFQPSNDPKFINANRISELSPRRLVAMFTLTRQLLSLGLAKIINVPQEREQVLRVARSLAYERPTGYGTVFDVVVEASEEINLAYSTQEFDLHIDLAYREKSPGVQLLHCITNSATGGLSYFSDAFKAANQLKDSDRSLYEVLLKFPATFVVRDPYRDLKFRRQQPMLSLDYRGNIDQVHYTPFMLPPVGHKDDVKLFYLALDKFSQLLHSKENKMITKMDPGELFIFHNRRVLHGRSSYDLSSGDRFLQGCYMDWDEIECLYEKVYSAIGMSH